MTEQERVEIDGWSAWRVGDVGEFERWMIAYDGDYTEVRATALLRTTRERRIDFTGARKSGYFFLVTTEMHVAFRVGWRKEFAQKVPYTYHLGRRAALKAFMGLMKDDKHLPMLRSDMDWAAHLAGATELERLDCWHEDDRTQIQALAHLLGKYGIKMWEDSPSAQAVDTIVK